MKNNEAISIIENAKKALCDIIYKEVKKRGEIVELNIDNSSAEEDGPYSVFIEEYFTCVFIDEDGDLMLETNNEGASPLYDYFTIQEVIAVLEAL